MMWEWGNAFLILIVIIDDDLIIACTFVQLFNWCGEFLAKSSWYIPGT